MHIGHMYAEVFMMFSIFELHIDSIQELGHPCVSGGSQQRSSLNRMFMFLFRLQGEHSQLYNKKIFDPFKIVKPWKIYSW